MDESTTANRENMQIRIKVSNVRGLGSLAKRQAVKLGYEEQAIDVGIMTETRSAPGETMESWSWQFPKSQTCLSHFSNNSDSPSRGVMIWGSKNIKQKQLKKKKQWPYRSKNMEKIHNYRSVRAQ